MISTCAWSSASHRSGGHEITLAVVVVVPLRVQHPQPVPDRDAGGHHQEPLGEPGVVRGHDLVDGLPRDDHRHHDGLAGAGGHLQRHPRQPVVVQLVLGFEAPPVVGGPVPASDLGEEDRGLGGLPLAEQHRLVAIRRPSGPVRQQLARVGGDAVPVVRAPPLDFAADVVDQRVLLTPLPGDVEVERQLLPPPGGPSC